MAKLSKKAPVVEEANVEYVPEEEVNALTEDEVEVIQRAEEEEIKESADTTRLQLATNIVSRNFNLDPSYNVKKFDDKGKVVKLTLENSEFIIDVTIKDSYRHGMYVEEEY